MTRPRAHRHRSDTPPPVRRGLRFVGGAAMPAHVALAVGGAGHPLAAPLRGFMERVFQPEGPSAFVTDPERAAEGWERRAAGMPAEGRSPAPARRGLDADFSRVRVHQGIAAERSAAALGAVAYALGDHIVLGRDAPAPTTPAGRGVIAHELAHVVQQRLSGQPAVMRKPKGRSVGGFFGNLFRFWDYSREELDAYLKRLDETGEIEDDDDSDDKARQIVALWKTDHGAFDLTARRKALLIREMASGYLSGADQTAILDLLDGSSGPDLDHILGAGGVRLSELRGRFDSGAERLAALERRGTPSGDRTPTQASPQATTGAPPAEDSSTDPKVTYEEALEEGGKILNEFGFGLSGGDAAGVDAADGYDARDWEEQGQPRGVIRAKIESWLAMRNMVRNRKEPVPSAGGGQTRWRFDCFEGVQFLHVYGLWRTLDRAAFNTRFAPLELGFFSKQLAGEWQEPFLAEKPGEKPFKRGEIVAVKHGNRIEFEEEKKYSKKTWKQLLDEAPIGTQIIWTNDDAKKKCAEDSNLSFCAFVNENATKLGQDRYSAHPFGVVNEQFIVKGMMKAVFGAADAAPPGYAQKNIYISAIRYLKTP